MSTSDMGEHGEPGSPAPAPSAESARPIFVTERIGGSVNVSMDIEAISAVPYEEYWKQWDAEVRRELLEWDNATSVSHASSLE